MPRGSFAHQVAVAATPNDVWERFQEPETWRGIGPIDDVGNVQIDGDRLVSFTWQTHVGPTRHRGKSSMIENTPGKRLVMQLNSAEMGGKLTVALTSEEDTTVIDVALDYATKGTMSSLFFPIISEAIANGLRTQVDDFAARWNGDA
jgi:hypothetical protein